MHKKKTSKEMKINPQTIFKHKKIKNTIESEGVLFTVRKKLFPFK